MGGDEGNRRASPSTPFWEWLVAGFAVLLVAGSIGYLAYQGVIQEGSAPDLVFETERVLPAGEGYLQTFRVVNRGGSTASNVVVEGRLESGGRGVETVHAWFDFVPPGSRRGGGLFFSHDPRGLDLVIKAGGYESP